MPKKASSASAETYEKALAHESQKEYEEACNVYKSIDKKSSKIYIAAQFAIARLSLQKHIGIDAKKCPSEIDYYEQGIDWLEKLELDKDNIKEESKKELTKCLKALDAIANDKLSREHQLKKMFLSARLNYFSSQSPVKYLEDLASVIKDGYEQAIPIFVEYVKKETTKKTLNEFITKKLNSTALSAIGAPEAYIYFKLLNKYLIFTDENSTQSNSPAKTPMGVFFTSKKIPSQTSSPEEKERIDDQLKTLADRIVLESDNLSWITDAIIFLKSKGIPLTDAALEHCLALVKREPTLTEDEEENYYYCICQIGEYVIHYQLEKGAQLIERGLHKIIARPEYAVFSGVLRKYYEENSLTEKLNELNGFGIDSPAKVFEAAEAEWKKWQSNNDVEALKLAIQFYKNAALKQCIPAAKKIKKLYDELENSPSENMKAKLIPEVILAYADLLRNLPNKILRDSHLLPVEKNKAKKLTTEKEKNAYINLLQAKARDLFEKILKNENDHQIRPDIFRVLAKLRYQGELFEKNQHFARYLLTQAELIEDIASYFEHAKMCFYGEGGEIDIKKAEALIKKIDLTKVSNKSEVLHLKAELLYLEYLRACDQKSLDRQSIGKDAVDCYAEAALGGHKDALISLFVMHQYDNEPLATEKLAKLFYAHQKDIPVLKDDDFFGMPSGKPYYLFFCAHLHREAKLSPELSQLPGLKDFLFEQQRAEQDLANKIENLISQFNIKLAETPVNEFCIHQLMNELILLSGNDLAARPRLIEILSVFYKKIDNGAYKLLTTLCYEAIRHEPKASMRGWQSNICQILFAVLGELVPKYKDYDCKSLQEELVRIEMREKGYFDECISDDSDEEAERTYQGSDKHHTADVPYNKPLIAKISEEAKKQLDIIEKLNNANITDEKYNKQVAEIKKLFNESLQLSPSLKGKNIAFEDSKKKTKILEDLQLINHYSATGMLAEGLKRISTPFVVVQARGLHFYISKWSQKQRRNFWKNIKNKEHPYLNCPVYSSAVYDRAGITDFTDYSGVVQRRLEKVARYIQTNLLSFPTEPYTEQDNVLPQGMFRHAHQSRHMQFQQLYSNNYAETHGFLKKERQNPASAFVSDKNPMVSTGDLNSCHPHYYAYGNKTYQAQESERLRPRYDKKGRALRPHSGFVEFTLHPLGDFAKRGCHHIPSLNFTQQLWIDWTIAPELECSFYSFIERDRLMFIHPARFPSFHHVQYPKIFLHAYGIDEALYFKFQKMIKDTAPHSNKQRLIILLLGQYLSAYQTIYYMRYIREKAERLGKILLFRDQHGNFSVKPCFDFSPTPHGDEDRFRLRRYFSTLDERSTTDSLSMQDSEMSEEEESMDVEGEDNTTARSSKRQKTTNSV